MPFQGVVLPSCQNPSVYLLLEKIFSSSALRILAQIETVYIAQCFQMANGDAPSSNVPVQSHDSASPERDARHGVQERAPSAIEQSASRSQSNQSSKLKDLWAKIGLDKMTLILMVKGSLPPTLAIAVYQADSFAAHYKTLGAYA